MDKFGVPKKINRHVIKAIYELTDQNESESSNLFNICDKVELTMKNNVPVPNLISAVRQSLKNLSKFGVVKKQGTNYFRNSENQASFSRKKRKSEKVWDEGIESLVPLKKKRRGLNEDSSAEYYTERSIKLPSRKKNITRKVKKGKLPKARKHTVFQLNHNVDEIERSSGSNSEMNESDINSEDENSNNIVSTQTEPSPLYSNEMLNISKLDGFESNKNPKNLLQLDDSSCSHQLDKFDYNSMYNQNTILDIIDENQSQHQIAENENISDNSQFYVKNEPVAFPNNNNEEEENMDGITNSLQNLNNKSTTQISEPNYLN